MIFLKLVDKQGNTLAETSGLSIDFKFDRVYEEGGKTQRLRRVYMDEAG